MCIWVEVTASHIYSDASSTLQEIHEVNESNTWFNYAQDISCIHQSFQLSEESE